MPLGKYTIKQLEDGSYEFTLSEDFPFSYGGTIHPLVLVYETYGELNADKSNVILIHHALSTHSHVCSTSANSSPGWWEKMIGPGCPIDTKKYFVICINNIGSCFGSSGPVSINPVTGKSFRADFPFVTMEDIAASQNLLLQALNINQLFAIVGPSMGGMISLAWGMHYPQTVQNLILISSCYKAYPSNIANRMVQQEIIKLDPAWQQGYYQSNVLAGLTIARKLGHFTYRQPRTLNEKFSYQGKVGPGQFSEVEKYLNYNAQKFANQFDANSYLYLLQAMDVFDVTRGFSESEQALTSITAKALVVGVSSDILYLPEQQGDLAKLLQQAGVDCQYIEHQSDYGHDAFLVDIDAMGKYICDFFG